MDWLDESTNTAYKKGYYDEFGNRYDNLILKNNQRYENVPMHCPYCDSTAVRDLTDDTETMACEHCGGNMIIDAILDEKADVSGDPFGQAGSYSGASAGAYSGSQPVSSARRFRPLIIFGIIMGSLFLFQVIIPSMFLGLLGSRRSGMEKLLNLFNNGQTTQQQTTQQQNTPTPETNTAPDISSYNPDIFGTTIYLKSTADGMDISDESDYDHMLVWVDSEDAYYDADSDCYVWFNTDMDPYLWQYWYEGISSSHESGWMEYENGEWYLETSYGNWEQVDLTGYGDRIWHFSDPYAEDFLD